MTCPDCRLECTIDELSVDTFSCPSCGLLLFSRSGDSGALVKLGVAVELSVEELERTRQWQASLDDILPTPQQLPRRLGRYELTELLGEGSFAQVYRAFDSELEREVALKIPRKQRFKSAEDMKRFLEEARMAAKLEHPGIVRVYDVGWMSDDVCFIAMEFCASGSLDLLLKAGPVSHQRAVEIIAEAADAIHFAHLKGLVHRDLKPSNIMFGRDGRVRIVDFGLALPEDQQSDREGEIAGTLPYMSPEQVRGETHHLDGRTDIWSLGILLYQMLAGRRPFAGNRQQLVAEILDREPKPPRQVVQDVPKELEAICLKCLAKPVTGRWATARDISEALQTWLDTRRSSLLSVAPQPMALLQTTPRRWVTQTLLLGLLLVVIPLGVFAAMALTLKPASRDVARELDPNWLDKQPALLAVPLLNRPPKKLAWPANSTSESLSADLVEASLGVDSGPMTLIELGQTAATKICLDAQFFKNVEKGQAGFFWGYQPDPQDPLISRCYAIYFRCDVSSSGKRTSSMELSYLTFKRMKSGSLVNIASNRTVSQEIEPLKSGGNRLEICLGPPLKAPIERHPTTIVKRKTEFPSTTGLESVTWNGQELQSLSEKWAQWESNYNKVARAQDPPFQTIHVSGRFGILNDGGSTLVRNAHFTLLSRPQP